MPHPATTLQFAHVRAGGTLYTHAELLDVALRVHDGDSITEQDREQWELLFERNQSLLTEMALAERVDREQQVAAGEPKSAADPRLAPVRGEDGMVDRRVVDALFATDPSNLTPEQIDAIDVVIAANLAEGPLVTQSWYDAFAVVAGWTVESTCVRYQDGRETITRTVRRHRGRKDVRRYRATACTAPRKTVPRNRERRAAPAHRTGSSSRSSGVDPGSADSDPHDLHVGPVRPAQRAVVVPGPVHRYVAASGLTIEQVKWCHWCRVVAPAVDDYQRHALDCAGFTTLCPDCEGER